MTGASSLAVVVGPCVATALPPSPERRLLLLGEPTGTRTPDHRQREPLQALISDAQRLRGSPARVVGESKRLSHSLQGEGRTHAGDRVLVGVHAFLPDGLLPREGLDPFDPHHVFT